MRQRAHLRRWPLRPLALLTTALVLLAALGAALATGGLRPATALATGQSLTLPFPRLGAWFPQDAATWPDAALGKYDYVVLTDYMAPRLPAIKTANPAMIALRAASACELGFDPTKPNTDINNVAITRASARWLLTQAGSRLTSAVSATATTFPVAATSSSGKALFAVGDFVVIDEEIAKVSAVTTTTLSVVRGQVHPAAAHAAATRVASAIQFWPKSVVMDITAACPAVTVEASVGPETWIQWDARHAADSIADSAWSGLFLDRTDANESWLVSSRYARTIDADRSNTVKTDYSAFNTSWNAGLISLVAGVRARIGDRPVLGNTDYAALTGLNGTVMESFPNNSGMWGTATWHDAVIGRLGFTRGSYLNDWMVKCPQPNLSSVLTYEAEVTPAQAVGTVPFDNPFLKPGFQPNYRKMRFGLATALLGDGFFYYGAGTGANNGHGRMWFDEYDNAGAGTGYLGQPLGAARAAVPLSTSDRLGGTGSFDDLHQISFWHLSASGDAGFSGTTTLDTVQKASGAASARMSITSAPGNPAARVVLYHTPMAPLSAGTTYTLTFNARADPPRNIRAWLQKAGTGTQYVSFESKPGSPDVPLDTQWRNYECIGVSSGSDTSTLNFGFGQSTGSVWIDDVKLQAGVRPEVYRRDYVGGVALVNPTNSPVTVNLGGTFRKIKGTQAPLVNDGSLVTSVTLPAMDGLVLLR